MRLWTTALVLLLALPAALRAQEPAGTPAAPAPAAESTPAPPPAPTAVAVEAPRVYLEKAVVTVDGKAEFAGSVQMEFLPLGGTAKVFEVRVLAKAKPKEIARDIHKEITLAAGQTYKVKLSGDEVRISKSGKAQNFAITITKLAITGVSVRVNRG